MGNRSVTPVSWEVTFRSWWFQLGWWDYMEGKPFLDLKVVVEASDYETGRQAAAFATTFGIKQPKFGMVHRDKLYEVLYKCQNEGKQGII